MDDRGVGASHRQAGGARGSRKAICTHVGHFPRQQIPCGTMRRHRHLQAGICPRPPSKAPDGALTLCLEFFAKSSSSGTLPRVRTESSPCATASYEAVAHSKLLPSRQRKLPVELVTRRAECTGSLRSRLKTAVCHCLPQGKQCRQCGPVIPALLLSKQ